MPEKKRKGGNFNIVRTPHNFKLNQYPKDGENFKLPTLTKPEMSMPIREIILRYQNGREVLTAKDAHYDAHLPFPDTSRMTKVERELYRRQIIHEVQDYEKRLAEHKSNEAAEKQQAILDEMEKLRQNQKPIEEEDG